MKTCVFVRWYNLNVIDEITKIKNETDFDVFLSLDYKTKSNQTTICPIHYYNEEDFNKSGMLSWGKICHKDGSFFRYNPEIALIDFKNRVDYDYYWLIEGDVKLAGNYKDFFSEYENIDDDLLAHNIRCDKNFNKDFIYETKDFHFSNTNLYNYIDKHFKAFMVVTRFSRKLLNVLEDSFKKGILGTNENIICNVCYYNNMKMRSFNNNFFKEEYYSDAPKIFNPNEHSFFHAVKR